MFGDLDQGHIRARRGEGRWAVQDQIVASCRAPGYQGDARRARMRTALGAARYVQTCFGRYGGEAQGVGAHVLAGARTAGAADTGVEPEPPVLGIDDKACRRGFACEPGFGRRRNAMQPDHASRGQQDTAVAIAGRKVSDGSKRGRGQDAEYDAQAIAVLA